MSAPDVASHRLGAVADIPVGEGRAFAVGHIQIAVFRLRDGLRATQALCPHAGGPLADGQADPAKIVCPLHSYAYSVHDGTCLNGPYTIRTYPAREEDGDIVVDV
jgi:nitrite reductase (NADH) small subunit